MERLVLRDGARLIGMGICGGLFLSFMNAHLLRGVLFEVSPNDPWSYAGTTLLIGLATTIAAYQPARRASEREPVAVLRSAAPG